MRTLTIDITENATDRRVASYIENILEESGMRVEIRTNDWPNFFERLREQNFELAIGSWSLQTFSTLSFYELFSEQHVSPSPMRQPLFNTEYVQEVNRISEAGCCLEVGISAFRRLDEILVEEAVWVPLGTRRAYWLYREGKTDLSSKENWHSWNEEDIFSDIL